MRTHLQFDTMDAELGILTTCGLDAEDLEVEGERMVSSDAYTCPYCREAQGA